MSVSCAYKASECMWTTLQAWVTWLYRATVNFVIVFCVLLRKNIGLKRRGLIFTFYLFLLEIRRHMRVFS